MNNTSQKSITLRPQVDGIVKKKEIIAEAKNKNHVPTKASLDDNKRMFLKVAGVAGLGLAASALIPKAADAYIAGTTPTSNVVGIKNKTNEKIDPATEDGNLAVIAGKDFATETTLTGIKTAADKFKFDGENLKVVSSGGGATSMGLNDSNEVRINPSSEESILYLRRIVKLMESQAVVDNQMRQRVVVDSAPSTAVTGTLTGVTTVTTVTTLNQLAGVDARWQIIDWARQAYNSGIRGNLTFI